VACLAIARWQNALDRPAMKAMIEVKRSEPL
jgi:hypothetical protein